MYMNYEGFFEIVNKRRSYRQFNEKKISKDVVEKIVKAGIRAPSGFNTQLWEFMIVDDEEIKSKLTNFIQEQLGSSPTSRGFVEAPTLILFYGDERVRKNTSPGAQKDDDAWNFAFTSSMAAAFVTMQMAATSLGLTSMWASSFRMPQVSDYARELLGVPDYLTAFEMMGLGYSDGEPKEKQLKELSSAIHYNQY